MPKENRRLMTVTRELTCHQCKSNFEVPVPSGPREEKELECPHCGSKEIGRVAALNQDTPQCGG